MPPRLLDGSIIIQAAMFDAFVGLAQEKNSAIVAATDGQQGVVGRKGGTTNALPGKCWPMPAPLHLLPQQRSLPADVGTVEETFDPVFPVRQCAQSVAIAAIPHGHDAVGGARQQRLAIGCQTGEV